MPTFLSGQSLKTMREREVKNLLSHKWFITKQNDSSKTIRDKKIKNVFPAELPSTVDFKLNGIVELDLRKGTWKYYRKNKRLIIKINNKDRVYTLLQLTKNEAVIESEENGVSGKILLWRE